MKENASRLTLRGTDRINYIDALRGLSMVLVVLAHVLLMMSRRHWDGSPLAAVLMSFRMPLFFYVSGFFAYKALDRWTGKVVSDIMVRKARAQILCATLFYMLYQLENHRYVLQFLTDGYGYFWFTIALFQMFAVYVALNLLSRLIRRNIVDWGLVILALICCYTGMHVIKSGIGVTLAWSKAMNYFPFFVAGILSRRHRDTFETILRKDWFRTVVIICFLGGCFVFYTGRYQAPHAWGEYVGQGILHRFAGLLSVLIFFHSRADYFDGPSPLARFLRFTGKRTLDIYMMHMFFMPTLSVYAWSTWLQTSGMSLLKLAVALPVTLAIVALCLLVSNLLRTSHFLSVWLFGVRNHPRNKPCSQTANVKNQV